MKIAKIVRKSVVANVNIPEGTKITRDMLAIKRPGTGIEPKHLSKVVEKTVKKDIKKDDLLRLEDLK